MLHYFLIYFSGIQGVKKLGWKVNCLYYKQLQTSTWLVLKMSRNLFWFVPFNQMEQAVSSILFHQLLFHTCNFTHITLRILLFSSLAYNTELKKLYFVKTGTKECEIQISHQTQQSSLQDFQSSFTAFLNCAVQRYLGFLNL